MLHPLSCSSLLNGSFIHLDGCQAKNFGVFSFPFFYIPQTTHQQICLFLKHSQNLTTSHLLCGSPPPFCLRCLFSGLFQFLGLSVSIFATLIYLQQNLLSNKSGYVTAILKFLQWLPGIDKKPGLIEAYKVLWKLALCWLCDLVCSQAVPQFPSFNHSVLLAVLSTGQTNPCIGTSLLVSISSSDTHMTCPHVFSGFHNATSLKRSFLTLLFKIIPQITPFQCSMLHPSYLPPIFSIALNYHLTYICSFQFFPLQCTLCHFLGEASYWWSNLKRSLC